MIHRSEIKFLWYSARNKWFIIEGNLKQVLMLDETGDE